jgi:oxygen-independent coproporphyrinogen III oxidase
MGFESVNVDLIYGLPLQTPESFDRTLVQGQCLRPDRIALYAYAHLPERFKPQRRIHTPNCPAGSQAGHALALARRPDDAGYVYVGMDHFALPGDDALAVAKRQGRLAPQLPGLQHPADCDLIALGVSAIGRIGATYSQNAKTWRSTWTCLTKGACPLCVGWRSRATT